jgi:4-amino-4-deoxy-L-arabinose transferase-like glycosyltransferase
LFNEPHPDLANAPVYPLLLAGLMKALPFNWEISSAKFWRYQPEMLIGWFNQALFFGLLFLVYRLGTRLFDRGVGYMAVVLMALTELFWEITTSGLSTMLLLVLFVTLLHALVSIEQASRENTRGRGWLLGMAAAAGGIVGLMALTRYSAGWLIFPVVAFIAAHAVTVRAPAATVAMAIFALLLGPWAARNYQESGRLFGVAGLAIHEQTTRFPGHTLGRSMPRKIGLELNQVGMQEYVRKLFVNSRDIVEAELPRTAGNWAAALFLGALLVPFRNPTLGRLKWLTLLAALVLLVAQALGRTELSRHSPGLNSENLLVLLSPVLFIFGAAFFFTLLDQVEFSFPWVRTAAIAGFVLLASLPLVFRLLPPRNLPWNFPPYYAPVIQEVSHWMEPGELMMADMPWATAWYGQRETVWTTMDAGMKPGDDFYRISDDLKAVKGIYLTPITTDMKFLTEMRQSREGHWGRFYLEVVVLKNLPAGFPLKIAPRTLLPEQLFVSDRIRWRE